MTRFPEAGVVDQTFDLVAGLDWLEHEEWDRWELQRIHRAMRPGGTVVLAVRSLFSLVTPDDAKFLFGRVRKVLAAKSRHGSTSRFTGRRYRRRALTSTLETLGFSIDATRPWGRGALGPIGRLAGVDPIDVARGFVIRAVRMPSLYGEMQSRPFPEPGDHLRRFDATQAPYERALASWQSRHPQVVVRAPQEIDPARYAGKGLLVLAPHPDDEIIGCGGLLLRAHRAGARVTVLQATDGSKAASLLAAPPEIRRSIRLEEAGRVARIMGFERVVCWREDNAAFVEREDLVESLVMLLSESQAAAVLAPFPSDVHSDHRTLCRMLAAALQRSTIQPDVLSYEVWSKLPVDEWCDVTREMPTLERALFEYVTALRVEDYVHFCQDRNYANSIRHAKREGYVEVFHRVPARDYAPLVDPA